MTINLLVEIELPEHADIPESNYDLLRDALFDGLGEIKDVHRASKGTDSQGFTVYLPE